MSGAVAPNKKAPFGLGKVGLVFACGTALFSDGYQNGVVGTVNTILTKLYPDEVGSSSYGKAFRSTAFAGTVAGMLIFGYLSDRIGRKFGMLLATMIVFVFAALSAGSYGAGGSITGMLAALAAWRFMIGIGIGAEYPAGSVAAAENTEDPGIKKGWQHGLFVFATNGAIDWGFVISAFVPLVLVWIFGTDHLRAVWRVSLGLGTIPPLLVFIWRLRMREPDTYRNNAIQTNVPYWLIVKKYWLRFTAISVAWFIYDFITYPFGIYSSSITGLVLPADASFQSQLGWGVVINLFYIPGTMIGGMLVDKVGPRNMQTVCLLLQAVFGFAMSGAYGYFTSNIAGFAVMYGVFLSLGEAGPGNCLGLLASKASPTAFRGKFYGGAAAIGKIGAFIGTWVFPVIEADFGTDSVRSATGPFWIGSGLAILSAIITFFFIPEIGADFMHSADDEFREYLAANGYDVQANMGIKEVPRIEAVLAGLDKDLESAEEKDSAHDIERKESL